jgi:hypothetical protein
MSRILLTTRRDGGAPNCLRGNNVRVREFVRLRQRAINTAALILAGLIDIDVLLSASLFVRASIEIRARSRAPGVLNAP